jgi:hypothetical protein
MSQPQYTKATLESRFDPSFFLYPIQNARTGYRPVWVPILLVEPVKRDPNSGDPVANAGVTSLTFFIEDAPNLRAPVAGYDHRGMFNPDLVLFKIDVDSAARLRELLDISPFRFFQGAPDGPPIPYSQAQDGDFFEYYLKKNDCVARVPFYRDADYYDLSAFEIATVDLPPNRYNFVWQAQYFARVATDDGEFKCIDASTTRLTNFRIAFAHPGEVHQEMLDKTPPIYYAGDTLDEEPLVKFYRPFADVLQDIFDEHSLLRGINWISKIPAQMMPYLAFLIGWDLPTFPDQDSASMDKVRRAILRNATRLQKLKSSSRAVYELFAIFGYAAKLVNTYFLVGGDGRLNVIAPDEAPPKAFAGQSVTTQEVCQLEPLLAAFSDESRPFGGFEIPLMYGVSGDALTLNAYLVTKASAAAGALRAAIVDLSADPNAINDDACATIGGQIVPVRLSGRLIGRTVLGHASVTIDAKTGLATSEAHDRGLPTISKQSVSFAPQRNIVHVGFDGSIDFADAELFVFASYRRTELIFDPPELAQRQSNRFDVDFTSKLNGDVDPHVVDYLISFLFRIKAFHSLLRKIKIPVGLTEVYNVTDFTAGGANRQKPGTSAGEAQVPPPIEPTDPAACQAGRGFKQSDIDYRRRVLDGLEQEHAAWKAQDAVPDIPANLQPVIKHLTRVGWNEPTRAECKYNPFGQDRVRTDTATDFDHAADGRQSVCDLTKKPVPDYTYTGRVKADADLDPAIDLTEIVRCRPCRLMVGKGQYIITPNPYSIDYGQMLRARGQQGSRYLGKLYRDYDAPQELIQFIHTPLNHLSDFKKLAFLGIQRPSLQIDKDNWFMPGHRHPSANALLSDFTHPLYRARPWDDAYSLITCAENRLAQNLLRARIEVVHGEEFLVYDDAPLIYGGNGLTPDISSFGNQDAVPFNVTHTIFLYQESRAWATFESVVETGSSCIKRTDSGFIDGLFKSATDHGDFVGGYPADRSVLAVGGSDGSGPFTVRFMFGSGIQLAPAEFEYPYHEGFRFDCDCNRFDEACGSGSGSGSASDVSKRLQACYLDRFRAPDGSYDFNCDQLAIGQTIKLTESVGTCSTLIDGSIPSCLCILNALRVPDGRFPPYGTFRYRDDYGVIYDGMFEFNGEAIDITVAIFSPRVPGEPESGFVERDALGRLVYMKRGVLTVVRQVIVITVDGYRIAAEGSESKITIERVNDICGDTPAVDNFCYHCDCQVADGLEIVHGSGGSSLVT